MQLDDLTQDVITLLSNWICKTNTGINLTFRVVKNKMVTELFSKTYKVQPDDTFFQEMQNYHIDVSLK